jgi:hypothetical protein
VDGLIKSNGEYCTVEHENYECMHCNPFERCNNQQCKTTGKSFQGFDLRDFVHAALEVETFRDFTITWLSQPSALPMAHKAVGDSSRAGVKARRSADGAHN